MKRMGPKKRAFLFAALGAVLFGLFFQERAAEAQEAIVVIKERAFTKSKRLELSAMLGWVPTNPFVTYFPLETRAAFHISEGFGLELTGGLYPFSFGRKPIKNQINDDLKKYPHFLGVKIYEQQVFYANLDIVLTPIYGKIRIAGFDWIAYWEIFFQFGGGITGVYNNEYVGKYASPTTNPIQLRPTVNFGAGNRLWVTRWFALRIDLRQYLFQKQVGRGGVSQHLTLMVGLSFII